MNIAMMCSMNTCTQTMKLQMKWQQRKSSGDYLTKGYSGTKESQKDQELQDPQSRLLESMKPDESASMRQQISTKMMAGKRLSSAEMEYLKENDPQTYQKARTIEMAQTVQNQRGGSARQVQPGSLFSCNSQKCGIQSQHPQRPEAGTDHAGAS